MADGNAPIVIDFGKETSKRIKQLKRGEGKLTREVTDAVAHVKTSLGAEASGKDFIPVVVVYKKKVKRRGLRLPLPF